MSFTVFWLAPQPLHIPDGMLGLVVALVCWAISLAVLSIALRKTHSELGERQAPLMGVMAAFIFAAQMLNFPVAGGTSGHLLGGALAAIVLGPWGGILVMTSVIIVQGLLFQDGGLIVMGANILNMGILTVTLGYGVYRLVLGRSWRVRLAAAGLGAWLSVLAAALATALQLWLSGVARLDLVAPAMLAVHALIGLGEAFITVAALSFVLRSRPALLEPEAEAPQAGRGWAVAGLLMTAVLVVLSPLAAADPDGLERVAENLGFIETSQAPAFEIMPDYTLPILGETAFSTIAAGAFGAVLVALLTVAVVRILRRQAARGK